jgi:hypothetical protein
LLLLVGSSSICIAVMLRGFGGLAALSSSNIQSSGGGSSSAWEASSSLRRRLLCDARSCWVESLGIRRTCNGESVLRPSRGSMGGSSTKCREALTPSLKIVLVGVGITTEHLLHLLHKRKKGKHISQPNDVPRFSPSSNITCLETHAQEKKWFVLSDSKKKLLLSRASESECK